MGVSVCLLLLGSNLTMFAQASAGGGTTQGISTLLTVEGSVELSSAGTTTWQAAHANHFLSSGDRIRTGERSRATLRLSNLSVIRINELTTLEIRPPGDEAAKPAFNLRSGSGYLFNRERPANVRFRTPTVAGAIRGTEFHLKVAEDGRTELALLEGAVDLQNAQGSLSLTNREQAVVEPGKAPVKTAMLNAQNIIQWSLYYPAVLDVNELSLADNQSLSDSLETYRSGDLLQALAKYPSDRQPSSEAEKIYRSAVLLAVGQVDPSLKLLEGLSGNGPAALQRMLAAVQGRKMDAPVGAASPSDWLAESYYQQSQSNLEGALQAAKKAAELSANFGYAWERVAELEFGFGRVAEAENALARSLQLSPRNAQALALQGFLAAARNEHEAALTSFNQAIVIDGALGNAWLGRGLVQIHTGKRDAGLQDLQVAATLEPQRAVLRSYLGKAFTHAGDFVHAEKELGLAKDLDPNDPTAWLYSALLFQRENRVNDAVRNLERSKDLNDNQSVFRSRQLLDQDRAVRSANLAAMYRDDGMFDVSAREAARAVDSDYGNYSSHLFLSQSYDALRDPRQVNLRYETPWLSELLVANLLAPANAGILSQTISQQDYSRLFEGNHFGVSSGTEYLSRGAWQQYGSQYGVFGNTGYSLDAYYQTDRGERPNNDIEQLTLSAKVKQQLTPQDSIYLQAIYYEAEAGDVAQYYNQASATLNQRIKEKQQPSLFAGYHHEWQPGVHTLVLAGRLVDDFSFNGSSPIFNLVRDSNGDVTSGFRFRYPVEYNSDFEAYSAEVQQIWQQHNHTLIAGGRFQTGENDVTVDMPAVQRVDTSLQRYNIYTYYYWQVLDPLKLMAGISYDNLDYPENADLPPISSRQISKDQISPKAGFYYTPFTNTTFRGVYTRSLGGLYYDASVRLEPAQLAGFNQAFRSVIPESVVGLVPGSEFETFGLALDQKLSTGTYLSASAELINSEADRTVGSFDLGIPTTLSSVPEHLDYQERTVYLNAHQLLGRDWALGAAYRNTEADLEDRFSGLTPALAAGANRDWSAMLHQVTLYANYNLPCGFFAQAHSIWSRQSNHGYSPALPGDDFWHFNIYAGYRFLQRRAELRLGLLNIGDRDYELNPLTLYSELPRHRTFAASFKFNF